MAHEDRRIPRDQRVHALDALCLLTGAVRVEFQPADNPDLEDDDFAIFVPGEEEPKGFVQVCGPHAFIPKAIPPDEPDAMIAMDLERTRAGAMGVAMRLLTELGWIKPSTLAQQVEAGTVTSAEALDAAREAARRRSN